MRCFRNNFNRFFNVNDQEMSPEYLELLKNAKELTPEQLKILNDIIKRF